MVTTCITNNHRNGDTPLHSRDRFVVDWAFTRYQLGSQLYIALMKNYPSISNFSKKVKILQKN